MDSLPSLRTADAAVATIPRGAGVVSGPGCGTPTTLLDALGAAASLDQGWRLSSALLLGPLGFLDAVRDGRLAYDTWHVVRGTRDLVAGGLAGFLPLRAAEVPRALGRRGVDVALVRVSPPDSRGYCSLGTSVSYTRAAVANARMVLAEVDPGMPRTHGRSLLHVSEITTFVDSEHPTPEYPTRDASPLAQAIATHVLELLPRDPVLQMGIGEIPEAITPLLAETDLGVFRFVGLGTDGMVPLIKSGRVAPGGGQEAIHAVELMGTRTLLDFADDHPAIGVYPVDVAGNPQRLAEIPRLVSLGTALQVDLSGQVNAEYVGGRQISGAGGAADFLEAARASDGGVRIVALPASACGASRIVPRLEPDAPVTLPRHGVDYVVTEFGVAALAGRSLRERAEALVAVAAPEHRGALTEAIDNQSSERGLRHA